MKAFDRQLGKEVFDSLPTSPGIYRFYNDANELIYVGKAKNLKRRLAQYRNAKRRKAHAKMRKIVKEATRLEYEACAHEEQALTLEMLLIQQHRPKWNVAGAFYFLYPMIGVKFGGGITGELDGGILHLCYTTQPELFPDFQFHGAFRSRTRTREGFFALIELMKLIGHVNKDRKERLKLPKYTYVYPFRQIPPEWQRSLTSFFKGEDFAAIESLSLLLLDRPTAVANSHETQDRLREIRRFWRHEIQVLKRARDSVHSSIYPVPQKERDFLFLEARASRKRTRPLEKEL